MQCSKCPDPIDNTKDVLTCVDCKLVIHLACIKGKKPTRWTAERRAAWKCDSCHAESSSKSDIEAGDTKILDYLENLKLDMNKQFRGVNQNVTGVKEQLTDVKNTMEELKGSIQVLTMENDSRREEVKNMQEENKLLKSEISNLKRQVFDIEQYSRRDNVEIVGVPFTEGEHLYDILGSIARVINVPYSPDDVSAVHRLPVSKRSKHPSIVAKFVRRSIKAEWISAARTHRRKLTAAELSNTFQPTWVYINDHLTLSSKVLLGRARELAKNRQLAFVWTKDCRVMVKRTPEGRATQVKNLEDLDRVLADPSK